MACGLPVVGFDTGALNELVIGDSGRIVAYGGDVWKLDHPDIAALAKAAAEILNDQPRFRQPRERKPNPLWLGSNDRWLSKDFAGGINGSGSL